MASLVFSRGIDSTGSSTQRDDMLPLRRHDSISPQSMGCDQSTLVERRERDTDSAWDLHVTPVFEQGIKVPRIIEAPVRNVRDEASTVTKGDLTTSTGTSRTFVYPSIAEEEEQRRRRSRQPQQQQQQHRSTYARDKSDEGVAPASKNCLYGNCMAMLTSSSSSSSSSRRRQGGGTRTYTEPLVPSRGNSLLKCRLKSKRNVCYASDMEELLVSDGADSMLVLEVEQESRSSGNALETENSLLENFSTSTSISPYATIQPPMAAVDHSKTWEEFDAGDRRWFLTSKMWPPPQEEEGVVAVPPDPIGHYGTPLPHPPLPPPPQPSERYGTPSPPRPIPATTIPTMMEMRDEVTTTTQTLYSESMVGKVNDEPLPPSRHHRIFPRTTPARTTSLLVEEKIFVDPTPIVVETPETQRIMVRREGPRSPARSYCSSCSSSSFSSQGSMLFVIQKSDYQIATQGDHRVPHTISQRPSADIDDDADTTTILEVGLD